MAASLLAGRLPGDLSAELFAIIMKQKELYANGSRRGEYAALNGNFHFALVRGSGNRYLLRSFAPVFWRSIMYTLLYYLLHRNRGDRNGQFSPASQLDQHEEIVSVLESGEVSRLAKSSKPMFLKTANTGRREREENREGPYPTAMSSREHH
ncbi:hypothetical protein MASR2M17_11220 [Aminivibrio sp.]